jgi:DNA-binding transcriptional MerR regulator
MSRLHPPTPAPVYQKHTARDVADEFNVTVRTIDRWVEQGILPPPITINKTRYWTRADLNSLERRERASTHTKEIA